uniref:RIN4 pathogenic type III effector avirulence factor Avr cleavage site domain-containing protein n=1 Tax=Aegilops tauschii subsp. strangulata TaxID=200361 RepID=A0A453SGE0_AEGTS
VQNRPSVPKFGTWDSDNVGYTVYFNKVRENKGATAPPLQRPFNPNDPEEEAPRVIIPGSRPATSSGDRAAPHQNGHQHRRAGSSTAEKSKFAPPPQYRQRQPPPFVRARQRPRPPPPPPPGRARQRPRPPPPPPGRARRAPQAA